MFNLRFLLDSSIIVFYFLFCFFFFTLIDVQSFFLLFFYFLLFQILVLFFIPKSNRQLLKDISLYTSLFAFLISLIFFVRLLKVENGALFDQFQFLYTFNWSKALNISYSVGIDGLSLFFILLTTFLTPICILVSWNSICYRVKDFLILLLVIEFFLVNVFIVVDLFYFFVFFESVLIPMFFMIGV